ncbi:hypothetical protein D1AOALGA4SA_12531 [Olavius algarvensis Delta 1 endosymbiont]|nr:hypothetical protein D1AOALGA4SA_12531 [Olavius algarvensis Delta 1 endosymbiont]
MGEVYPRLRYSIISLFHHSGPGCALFEPALKLVLRFRPVENNK